MTTTAAILETLTAAFADIDAADLAKEIESALARKIELREYKASDAYTTTVRNYKTASLAFDKCYSIAGGKGWYDVLTNNGENGVIEFCKKNSAARAAKRAAKIAKDLAKLNVLTVESSEVVRDNGGFDGVYRVTTDKGDKTVRINTILAGGYNVQCLHTRVLVSVK